LTILIREDYAVTKSGMASGGGSYGPYGGASTADEDTNAFDPYGRTYPTVWSKASAAALDQDLANSVKLADINLQRIPIGSDNQKVVCQQLASIWMSWAATVDQLGAEQFFCSYIEPYFDSATESGLINRCVTRKDLNGKVVAASSIDTEKHYLVKAGYRSQALLVSAKMKELQCEMPDASVMKK